jgi:hypothetical protein
MPRTRRRGPGGRFDKGGGRSDGRFSLHLENLILEILLGTIESTQRKGVAATSQHWRKEQGETDQSWLRRIFQLDLDEQETVRLQFLLGLACHDLLKARQEDEDF